MINCIQGSMKCDCFAEYPKGGNYHPSFKSIYWRIGANGKFVRIGVICPNCHKVVLEI